MPCGPGRFEETALAGLLQHHFLAALHRTAVTVSDLHHHIKRKEGKVTQLVGIEPESPPSHKGLTDVSAEASGVADVMWQRHCSDDSIRRIVTV